MAIFNATDLDGLDHKCMISESNFDFVIVKDGKPIDYSATVGDYLFLDEEDKIIDFCKQSDFDKSYTK